MSGLSELGQKIFEDRYAQPGETPEDLWRRVAHGIAKVETDPVWEERFYEVLKDWKFVPAGRILTAAGTDQQLTYYNCNVLASPKDSREGIMDSVKIALELQSRGGGVGVNISSLRPRDAQIRGVNGKSSGAVSWGELYSDISGKVCQGGSRRGATLLLLADWHPDIFEFINAKRESGRLTNANVSVAVSDALMQAVKDDLDWPLMFPDTEDPDYDTIWDGDLKQWVDTGHPVKTYRTVKARELWSAITSAAHASGEPGVLFLDRCNAMSNTWYTRKIVGCNPCGEQPLAANAVCNLGAINLARFVENGETDWQALKEAVTTAVRFLDDVIDVTPYFFEDQMKSQQGERRIGLGVMGLAEYLIRLGYRYGSPEAAFTVGALFENIATNAYSASIAIAKEKGAFPLFDKDRFLESGYMGKMSDAVCEAVETFGIRNAALLTCAPTGSIGTMVGTSTGIEPYYSWSYTRKSRLGTHEERVPVYEEWCKSHPDEPLPDYFVTAMELTPEEHIRMQAAIQRWVDSSISKTINLPSTATVEDVSKAYHLLYETGCKGGTVFRDGCRDEQVLTTTAAPAPEPTPAAVRSRPYALQGVTVSRPTPVGTAHITMNDDEHGPFEVFVDVGKGGSDIRGMAEALGRVISLALRIPSEMTPRERVCELVDQLDGIGGRSSIGFGKFRVLSLPDALAKALAQQYLSETTPDLPEAAKPIRADLCPQCGEVSLVREEGCSHCLSCGYSRC